MGENNMEDRFKFENDLIEFLKERYKFLDYNKGMIKNIAIKCEAGELPELCVDYYLSDSKEEKKSWRDRIEEALSKSD